MNCNDRVRSRREPGEANLGARHATAAVESTARACPSKASFRAPASAGWLRAWALLAFALAVALCPPAAKAGSGLGAAPVGALAIVALAGGDGGGCPWDLDGDGFVDSSDLGVLLGAWGGSIEGVAVDGGALGSLLGSWGPCPGVPATCDRVIAKLWRAVAKLDRAIAKLESLPPDAPPEERIELVDQVIAQVKDVLLQIDAAQGQFEELAGSDGACTFGDLQRAIEKLGAAKALLERALLKLQILRDPFLPPELVESYRQQILFQLGQARNLIQMALQQLQPFPACVDADHDCLTAGTPGCTDRSCCALICSQDPFCCEVAWDEICVTEAAIDCYGKSDCCFAGSAPGCGDGSCEGAVCAVDPFCCAVSWDSLCAEQARELCAVCGACGGAGAESCCAPHGTPLCDDALCCEGVCLDDPFCCEVEWDLLCVAGAASNPNCGCTFSDSCGAGGDCFEEHRRAGCDDAACCEQVCAFDAYCCLYEWDGLCVDEAFGRCLDKPCQTSKASCFGTNPVGGCNDEGCCLAVCNIDPSCCLEAWDVHCIALAKDLTFDCFAECPCPPWPTAPITQGPGAGFATPACAGANPLPKLQNGLLLWGGQAGQNVGVLESSSLTKVKLVRAMGQAEGDVCCKKCRVGFIQNLLASSRVGMYAGGATTTVVFEGEGCTLPLNDSTAPPFYNGPGNVTSTGNACDAEFSVDMRDRPGGAVPLCIAGKKLERFTATDTFVTWLALECPAGSGNFTYLYHWEWTNSHDCKIKNNDCLTAELDGPHVACATVTAHGAGKGANDPVLAGKSRNECAKVKRNGF
ncbi:MAG TPA: hypothetical protein PKC43_05330 [Phycisphaerales bacterium]|nr:hypothetical protein [Phycisphaerales bacterium]HMP36853.1 hypothetical protein [Phycisphaerales bacterium]